MFFSFCRQAGFIITGDFWLYEQKIIVLFLFLIEPLD